jgi:SAM-dependent methyltransferase
MGDVERLDVGSGGRHLPGYVSLDKDRATAPNVLHDIEVVPWPFPDNSFDEVRAHHIFEHIHTEAKTRTMYEAWRILKPGGVLDFEVPAFPSPESVQDPGHLSFWHANSLMYYEDGNRFRNAYASRCSEPVPRFKIRSKLQEGFLLKATLEAVKP